MRSQFQGWIRVKQALSVMETTSIGRSKRIAEVAQAQAMEKRLCTRPQLLFRYDNTVEGRFMRRYKRFLADVRTSENDQPEEIVVAHCPNTGPMLGLLDTHLARCVLSRSDNPKRKCKFTFELIQAAEDGVMVGVHSAKANAYAGKMLEQKMVPGLGEYSEVMTEVVFGENNKSRCDFVLLGPLNHKTYIEVKSVTYAQPYKQEDESKIGLFPDTVTTRGQKHIRELMNIVEKSQGSAACLFVVQRKDCSVFAASFSKDPEYSHLLVKARDSGVKVIAVCIDFVERENGWDVVFMGPLEVDLDYKDTI